MQDEQFRLILMYHQANGAPEAFISRLIYVESAKMLLNELYLCIKLAFT